MAGSNIVLLAAATGSNEGFLGYGWNPAYAGTISADGEIGPMMVIARLRDYFQRFPTDPDSTRLQPGRNRFFSIDSSTTSWVTGFFFATYHTIDYTLTGSISGSSGDGSGINVDFFRSDNDDYIATTTTTTGGQFQALWYDNNIPLYAVARQDDTHVGRSANSTASGVP